MQPRNSSLISGDEIIFPVQIMTIDEKGRRKARCLDKLSYITMDVKNNTGSLLFTVVGYITNSVKGYVCFDLKKEQTSQREGIYPYQIRVSGEEVLKGETVVDSVLRIKERL